MARPVRLWSREARLCDVDMDAPTAALVPVLEAILEDRLWNQFQKFPTDTLVRLLPQLRVDPATRRLVEIWIEEAPARAKARELVR